MAKARKAKRTAHETVVTRHKEDDTIVSIKDSLRPSSAPGERPPEHAREGDDKIEHIQRVVSAARTHLGTLLTALAGKTFEPDEATAASEAVSLVNHLAAILKTPLVYEGHEVSLKCNFQKGNGRPMFNLRKIGTGEQSTVYARKSFPFVQPEKTPLRG